MPKGGFTTMYTQFFQLKPSLTERIKEDHDRELQKREGCASP